MYMPPMPQKPKRRGLKILLIVLAVWSGFVILMSVVVQTRRPVTPETGPLESGFASASALADPTPTPAPTPMSAAALDEAVAQFPLRITESNYIMNLFGPSYAGDAFQATLENGSAQDILDARVILEAWDSNGLPIVLNMFAIDGSYGVVIPYDGINLVPQGVFSDAGYEIDYGGAANRISYYKAAVLEYTTVQGETVTNPYIEEWVGRYDGKKLELAGETFSSPQAMMDAGALNGTLSAVKNIIPSALAEEASYGGTVTATENGFLFTYDVNLGFAEGNDTLTQGYGNAHMLQLMAYGAVPLAELRDGLQTYCGIESPVLTVALVDGDGATVYSEDITSDIIDSMETLS